MRVGGPGGRGAEEIPSFSRAHAGTRDLVVCRHPPRSSLMRGILLFFPYSRALGRKDRAESALMEKVGSISGVSAGLA